ncbi:MAG: ATP synthase F1 subunit delta [bacterium]
MITGSIGRRYARALLDIAREQKKTDEVLAELEAFQSVLSASNDLNFVMTDPTFDPLERKKTLESIAGPLKLSPTTLQFLKLLIDRERMVNFPEVLVAYREMADAYLGRVRVKVSLSETLPDASREKLERILEKMTGKKVVLETVTRPDLLGGMVIQIQDLVFDGSVRSALNRMKEKMMQVVV